RCNDAWVIRCSVPFGGRSFSSDNRCQLVVCAWGHMLFSNKSVATSLLPIVTQNLAAVGRAGLVPREGADRRRQTTYTAVCHGNVHSGMRGGRHLPIAGVGFGLYLELRGRARKPAAAED